MKKVKHEDESEFQKRMLDRVRERMPDGTLIMKNTNPQGIPDWTILHNEKWAMLEMKDEEDAEHQPNQDTYLAITNEMSFSRLAYPEDEEEVLNELFEFFGV